MIRVEVQAIDFDHGSEYQSLRHISSDIGAVVTFTGLVRDLHESHLKALELEHYPGMTEKSLLSIANKAFDRWSLQAITVIHRFGKLSVNEQIVFVGVASSHREYAFDAASFVMDILKTEAPFWKKEISDQGSHWLDAKSSDDERAQRWSGYFND